MRYASLLNMAAMLLIVLMLTACIGGQAPTEHILRITQTAAISKSVCDADAPIIAMSDLDCFPALDRSAVMVANRDVLTPSPRWYWEGSPATIVSAALATSLHGQNNLVLVWPARNRMEHHAMLTGRVEVFEVREGESAVHMRVSMALWTPRGKQLLLTHAADAHRPLSMMSAQSIAAAASLCLADITKDIGQWLQAEGIPAVQSCNISK